MQVDNDNDTAYAVTPLCELHLWLLCGSECAFVSRWALTSESEYSGRFVHCGRSHVGMEDGSKGPVISGLEFILTFAISSTFTDLTVAGWGAAQPVMGPNESIR